MGQKPKIMEKLEMIAGGRYLMASHQDIIKNFVTQNHLIPVNLGAMKSVSALEGYDITPIYLKYGGHINPHLHLGQDVYIINDKQWKEFSKILLTDFKKKLDATNGITFRDSLRLSNVIDA